MIEGNGAVLLILARIPPPFIVKEEKELVPYDRSTQHAAELITLQTVPLSSKEVTRVQRAVSQKLKRRSVEFIGTRFCDGVHCRA